MKNLKTTLMANAIFSFSSGLIATIFSAELSNFLSIENPIILIGVGIGLVLFGVDVFYVSMKKWQSKKRVAGIIIADFAWVAVSIALLLIRPFPFSANAMYLIGGLAAIVLTFGLLQKKFSA